MVSVRSIASKRACCVFLAFVAISLLSICFLNNTSAVCNSDGYCYGTGSDPRGGRCGDPNNTGAWWDTCFGLSWQYYSWPEGYTGDISFPGSTNAGYATVSGQCAEYGGFWFLGYEVYRPSTGQSLGYQAGAPRVKMLEDYDSLGGSGYVRLIVGENPQPNPAITLNTQSGTKRLVGDRYGDADAMNDVNGDIYGLFRKYAQATDGQLGLVSGSGKGGSSASFEDLNWFCAAESVPESPSGKTAGLVEVVSGNRKNSTGWNNSAEADIYITINEGETTTITFNDYMKGSGSEVNQSYTIRGDFVGATPERDIFMADEGDESIYTVGTHTQTVSTPGKYCEILEFTSDGVTRIMHACAVVKVIPTPPEIYGRVGVEATIYDKDGAQKDTVSLSWSDWNDTSDPPLTVPIAIDNSDYVDIKFYDAMKGVGANAMDVDYIITNNALAGKITEGTFAYAGTAASGQSTSIKETEINDVNQASLICETLTFGEDVNEHSVVACARVTKGPEDDLTRTPSGEDGFDFNVDVDLKLSVTLSNKLVKDAGINGEFLRDYTTIGVSSNSHSGYIASFTTDKKSTNENATNLIHDYMDSVVPTLTSSVTRGEFPAGRWGYSIDDTQDGDDSSTYSPLVAMDSATPITIIDVDEPHSQNQDIYFGAKMDVIQPTGTYSNSIVFKVVTKVTEPAPTTIDDIEYMQDINDDVLASMVVNQQYQLTDVRDGKKYWVVKLKNDYVMMSQDLAFELHYGDVLSSDTTDIGYGDMRGGYKSGRSYWFIDHTTQTDKTDPLLFAYRTKANGDQVPQYVTSGNNFSYNVLGGFSYTIGSPNRYFIKNGPRNCSFTTYYLDDYFAEQCSGYVETYLDDAECASATEMTEAECAHVRAGVLYNTSAANGGGDMILNAYRGNYERFYAYSSTDSVCPKGWRMISYSEYDLFRDRWPKELGLTDFREAPLYFRSTQLAYGRGTQYTMYYDGESGSINYNSGSSPNEHYLSPVRCVARYGMKE